MQDGWIGRDIVLYFRPTELMTGPAKRTEADQSATPDLSLGPLMDHLPPVRVKTPTALPQSSETPSAVPTFYQCPCVPNVFFPSSVVEEVWQEQTLLKLLTLVELPLLEGLLQCSQSPAAAQTDLQLTCSSRLDRRVLEAFGDSR